MIGGMNNKELMDALKEGGVFDIRGGQAVLHFDGDGVLRKIELHHTSYHLSTAKHNKHVNRQ